MRSSKARRSDVRSLRNMWWSVGCGGKAGCGTRCGEARCRDMWGRSGKMRCRCDVRRGGTREVRRSRGRKMRLRRGYVGRSGDCRTRSRRGRMRRGRCSGQLWWSRRRISSDHRRGHEREYRQRPAVAPCHGRNSACALGPQTWRRFSCSCQQAIVDHDRQSCSTSGGTDYRSALTCGPRRRGSARNRGRR
jgi:hypothetical protein